MRRAAVLALLLACGRIGFQTIAAGSGSAAGDGGPRDGGVGDGDAGADAAAGCVYLTTCTGQQVTCCVGSASTCTPSNQCTGGIIACDINTYTPCPVGEVCCGLAVDGGTACYGGPPFPC